MDVSKTRRHNIHIIKHIYQNPSASHASLTVRGGCPFRLFHQKSTHKLLKHKAFVKHKCLSRLTSSDSCCIMCTVLHPMTSLHDWLPWSTAILWPVIQCYPGTQQHLPRHLVFCIAWIMTKISWNVWVRGYFTKINHASLQSWGMQMLQ